MNQNEYSFDKKQFEEIFNTHYMNSPEAVQVKCLEDISLDKFLQEKKILEDAIDFALAQQDKKAFLILSTAYKKLCREA